MNSTEATEVFFATTKLFQSKDISLRRLVYLAIKEMSKIADDVIIVTSRYMYMCIHTNIPQKCVYLSTDALLQAKTSRTIFSLQSNQRHDWERRRVQS